MLKQLFLDHPESVDETYGQHFVFALKFSARLLVAGGAALVHAFIPALCERTASRIIADLYQRTQHRSQ